MYSPKAPPKKANINSVFSDILKRPFIERFLSETVRTDEIKLMITAYSKTIDKYFTF